MINLEEISLYKNYMINPITEIQFYLREISKQNPEIPLTYINGTYSSTTKNAVTEFQKKNDLPPTGIVNLNTWNKIVHEYNKIYKTTSIPKKVGIFPSYDYEAKLGDECDIIYVIQIILKSFNKKYKNYCVVDITGKYDQNTLDAVSEFQKVNSLTVTGVVDKTTWDAMTIIFDTYKFNLPNYN